MKIHEHYSQEVKPGDVGIEIEVEYRPTHSLITNPGGAWLAKEDGSIGYGMEYITRSPLRVGPTLLPKISALTEQFKPEAIIADSPKTGVHVHVNVQELTTLQVWTAITTYWLIENALVLYCGQQRMHNHFCLRLNKSEGILGLCYNDLSTFKHRPFAHFSENSAKYGSLNLATVSRLGTLEVRCMRSTVDPTLIASWAEAIYYLIHTSAKLFSSPEDVFDYFLSCTKNQFLYRVLPASFVSQITSLPNYEGLAKENKKILAPLAYYHDDWNAWHKNVIEAGTARLAAGKLNKTTAELLAGATINSIYVGSTNPTPSFEDEDF